MLYETEAEKLKAQSLHEKQIKTYEKIEKKLFSNLSLVYQEVIENPSEELRVVLYSNREDLCQNYFHTLQKENEDDENKFIEIFKFIFFDKKFMVKSKTNTVFEMKGFVNIAIEKDFVRAIDTIFLFYQQIFDIKSQIDLFVMKSILEDNNRSFIEYMITPLGENGKKTDVCITLDEVFNNPLNIRGINTKSVMSQKLYDALDDNPELNIRLRVFKEVAFLREDYFQELKKRIEETNEFSKKIKNTGDLRDLNNKVKNVLDVFTYMSENTLAFIITKLNKESPNAIVKYINILGEIKKKFDELSKANNSEISRNKFEDIFFEEKRLAETRCIVNIHKVFMMLINDEQKFENINKLFQPFEERYKKKHVDELNHLNRERVLEIKLYVQDKEKIESKRKKNVVRKI